MARLGVSYGKGLQLINVLRDRNADLRNGRDYLPTEELAKSQLEEVFARWLGEAEEQLDAGIDYCSCLTNWRVRFATALPALIGARTIALLRAAGPAREKIKVPRRKVQLIVLAALVASVSAGGLRALHARLRGRPA
jgi:farnesyl-diphosphate farnesyltransferase